MGVAYRIFWGLLPSPYWGMGCGLDGSPLREQGAACKGKAHFAKVGRAIARDPLLALRAAIHLAATLVNHAPDIAIFINDGSGAGELFSYLIEAEGAEFEVVAEALEDRVVVVFIGMAGDGVGAFAL